MCCEPTGALGIPDGECPDCGEATVDGESTEICAYSNIICTTCGWAPCSGAC